MGRPRKQSVEENATIAMSKVTFYRISRYVGSRIRVNYFDSDGNEFIPKDSNIAKKYTFDTELAQSNQRGGEKSENDTNNTNNQ